MMVIVMMTDVVMPMVVVGIRSNIIDFSGCGSILDVGSCCGLTIDFGSSSLAPHHYIHHHNHHHHHHHQHHHYLCYSTPKSIKTAAC